MPTDLYGGNAVKPFLGRIVLKKLAGVGPIAVGSQITIPHAAAQPRNPTNTTYLAGISGSAYLSGDVAGKRTPRCTITSVVKTSSFFTADLINSLMLTTSGTGDTDVWAILLDDLYSPMVYDGAKCAAFKLQQQARGGPMAITLSFVSMYGDSENTGVIFSPTTFTSTTTDAGPITDVTKVSFEGSADLTLGFSLELTRPQSYVFYDDGTLYPAGISSGLLTGAATLTQSVKYSSSWESAGAINIGQTGAGLAISLNLSSRQDVREFKLDTRTVVRRYALYNSGGGAPISVTSL